jgi:Tol biopolymer transport system component
MKFSRRKMLSLAGMVARGSTFIARSLGCVAFAAEVIQAGEILVDESGPITVRVQSIDDPKQGYWVAMPGFQELGSPSFSKDGEWIAFDAYKDGYDNSPSECWVARKDGRDITRLAIGATPRWSPDGKQLLFMRDAVNDPSREPGIFIINRDGTGTRRVGDGRWPDWSPDGKSIVFSLGGRRGPWGGSRIMSRVYTASADGSGRKEIADGDSPTWSPDGKKIACIQQDPAFPAPIIRVVDLESDDQRFLGYGWFRANWSPDGKALASLGYDKDGQSMMLVRPSWEPGDQELIYPDFKGGLSPSFSADGKWMIFLAHRPKAG